MISMFLWEMEAVVRTGHIVLFPTKFFGFVFVIFLKVGFCDK